MHKVNGNPSQHLHRDMTARDYVNAARDRSIYISLTYPSHCIYMYISLAVIYLASFIQSSTV